MNAHYDIHTMMDALSYAHQFNGHSILIKLGGSILNDPICVAALCQDLKLLKGVGIHIIIVHGGGKAINRALEIHRINSHFIDGLRVTSTAAMEVIEMVLCGHVNSMLVKQLNHIGISAIGLTGADDHLLQCEPISEQHERVGCVKTVNIKPIMNVIHSSGLQTQPIPIIAPIGIDAQGQSLNVNADVAACEIAMALGVDKLIYLTDQEGIFDTHGQLLSLLDTEQLQQLIGQHIVKDGMLTKVRAIITALQTNMNNIHIINGRRPHALIEELFTVTGIGTLCKSTSTGVSNLC